jgi:hypothetical protein
MMNDDGTPRRMIEIGTLPSGFDATFIGENGVDPLAVMIREGNARLDRIAEEERQREAARLADIERLASTKRARVRRRLGKALKMFARLR